MSHSQFHSIEAFILRHAWLSLWDKHMTTGRINQVTIGTTRAAHETHARLSLDRPRSEGRPTRHTDRLDHFANPRPQTHQLKAGEGDWGPLVACRCSQSRRIDGQRDDTNTLAIRETMQTYCTRPERASPLMTSHQRVRRTPTGAVHSDADTRMNRCSHPTRHP